MSPTIFKRPEVRDLAWAGFAPQLLRTARIRGTGLELSDYWRERLTLLDDDPAPLLDFLAVRQTTRLGLYYEALWQFLLREDPDTELIAHNYPVRDGGQTVGEFDCLYWSQRDRCHVHLELAVKFYLGLPDSGIWLGPGRRDRLDRKLSRMLGHQSRLSAHPAARAALADVGIERCESRIDFKGYLFAPAAGMAPPEAHNPDCPLERWYTFEQFTRLAPLDRSCSGWEPIPRDRWLSRYTASAEPHLSTVQLHRFLADRLTKGGRPVQLAACDSEGIEQYRCFITPDVWPGTLQS